MYFQIPEKPLGLLINFAEILLMTAFDGSPDLYILFHPNRQKWQKPNPMAPHFDYNPAEKDRVIKEMIADVSEAFHTFC